MSFMTDHPLAFICAKTNDAAVMQACLYAVMRLSIDHSKRHGSQPGPVEATEQPVWLKSTRPRRLDAWLCRHWAVKHLVSSVVLIRCG